jgi:hypothetical protein
VTLRPADNPFSSGRTDGLRYRFLRNDLGSVVDRLEASGWRGAIVGPKGSGKTTLLEELARHLRRKQVWIRLSSCDEAPFLTLLSSLPAEVDHRHAILIDGAEQLDRWRWWRCRRRIRHAGVVVITGHRPGRLPTVHECATSSELLADLVGDLSPETPEAVDLDDLFQRHHGNLRLCFRELYDLHAGRRRQE